MAGQPVLGEQRTTLRAAARRRRAVVLCLALAAAGCSSGGRAGQASGKARTIDVEMVDTAFKPATLTVERGETVTFRFHNSGTAEHEALVGDRKAQEEHEAGMGGMHGHHMAGMDDDVAVKPGKTGEVRYTFDKAGTVEIGCHERGHWAAGMKIEVTVT